MGQLRALSLIRAWHQSAGPVLLKQAQFFGVKGTPEGLCLQLHVADPLWRQELEFSKKEILQRFNQKLQALGLSAAACPKLCSLHFGAAVPLKPIHPQKRRNK